MPSTPVAIARPQRWDVPFGPEMTDEDARRVLGIPPFSEIDPGRFPASTSLEGIIRNDCRIVRRAAGDILVREGDYGSSLFFIMSGAVRVALDALPAADLGRRERERKGIFRAVAQLWTNRRTIEYRDVASYGARDAAMSRRGEGTETRIFLQDVPAVLDQHQTARLDAGEFFGELAALARIPRTATVFAETDCELLELRWQGFRDLRRRADDLREYVDRIYRERALKSHLRAIPFFAHLNEEQLRDVADQTVFETFGEFDWYASYRKITQGDAARRLAHEPVIAEEGHYPNGVILIRNGFARLSQRQGNGERTLSYLGRGQVYGLDEIARNAREESAIPLQTTLRAIGYVDILRIPTVVAEKYMLPAAQRDRSLVSRINIDASAEQLLDPGLMEGLVENRYINGTATMIIDLDRCTRCDDCVTACAETHDGNPRFVRHGLKIDHYMVPNACMHCADPVCMIGCPTGAIHRDPDGGEVVINDLTCIGCATCANSCPYDNIRMVDIRDNNGRFVRDDQTGTPISKATKCDLCVDQRGGPACQRACPHDALIRMDMSNHGELQEWVNR